MKRWCTLLVLLGSFPGCAVMEDLVLGPDPHPPQMGTAHQPTSCTNPGVSASAPQTQEPELFQVRK